MSPSADPNTPFAAHKDFRVFLQATLFERCRKNPNYSLRAFANSLGVNHASLSRILRGERALSSKMQERLGTKLGLSAQRIASFTVPGKDAADEPMLDHELLQMDAFEAISDWYHDAILELVRLPGFKAEPKRIARTLGITATEAAEATERLLRLGLLRYTAQGEIGPGPDTSNILSPDYTSTAVRRLQMQIFEKAHAAITQFERARRDHTSITVAINGADLPQVRERIRRFRRSLSAFVQREDVKPDQVYQLAIGFFPLASLTPEELIP